VIISTAIIWRFNFQLYRNQWQVCEHPWMVLKVNWIAIQSKLFSSKPLHVACITQTLLIYQRYELAKTSEYSVCVCACVCVCVCVWVAFHSFPPIMLYRMLGYQQPSHNPISSIYSLKSLCYALKLFLLALFIHLSDPRTKY